MTRSAAEQNREIFRTSLLGLGIGAITLPIIGSAVWAASVNPDTQRALRVMTTTISACSRLPAREPEPLCAETARRLERKLNSLYNGDHEGNPPASGRHQDRESLGRAASGGSGTAGEAQTGKDQPNAIFQRRSRPSARSRSAHRIRQSQEPRMASPHSGHLLQSRSPPVPQ